MLVAIQNKVKYLRYVVMTVFLQNVPWGYVNIQHHFSLSATPTTPPFTATLLECCPPNVKWSWRTGDLFWCPLVASLWDTDKISCFSMLQAAKVLIRAYKYKAPSLLPSSSSPFSSSSSSSSSCSCSWRHWHH